MRLGLLPALGGGIRELARTGQVSRLVDGYFRPYVEAFDEIVYFSYLTESIAEHTQDMALRKRVRIIAPPGPLARGRWARQIPWRHAAGCGAATCCGCSRSLADPGAR